MDELTVVLLGGARVAAAVEARVGIPVVASTVDDHLDVAADVAADVGADGRLVVGLATVPWPAHPDLHAQGSATLPAYTGVVSWHALPLLLDALAAAVEPAARRGAHVLITAPDPGPDTAPEDVLFLREVAEGIAARTPLRARSIAWRGDTRAPTARDAVTALVEAHGHLDVLECPVAPGTGADPDLEAAAAELGLRLTCADLGVATLIDALVEVVRTVAGHEGAA